MGNSGIPSTSYVKTVLIFQFLFFVSLIINFDVFYIFLSKLRSCFRCSGMHVLINIEGQPISFETGFSVLATVLWAPIDTAQSPTQAKVFFQNARVHGLSLPATIN